MAEVYWIHLPEHTDMFSQGYIGFTAGTTVKRWKEHCRDSKRSDGGGCYKLYRALLKHGHDNFIVDTLCICENDYGLWLENKLRPTANIGYNLAVGGLAPMLGRKHTEETIQKQMCTWQESFTEDRREALKRASKASAESWTEERRKQASLTQLAIAPQRSDYRNHSVDIFKWVHAEEFYTCFLRGVRPKTLEKALSKSSKSFNKMFKLFEKGWIPTEDSDWMSFRTENECSYDSVGLLRILKDLSTPQTQYEKHNRKLKEEKCHISC